MEGPPRGYGAGIQHSRGVGVVNWMSIACVLPQVSPFCVEKRSLPNVISQEIAGSLPQKVKKNT